jgi:mono/diheme cytochrome c family protein
MSFVFPPIVDLPLIVGLIALVMGAAGFVGPARYRGTTLVRTIRLLRLPALAVGFVLTLSAFFAATPTTRLPNPIAPTVQSLEIGRQVYLNNCSACHGADARGGGPQAGTTAVRPPPLTGPGSHLGDHTDGDLHWQISNGTTTGMPAWAGVLTDDEIWHVVNYLRSLQ